jgi:large subunit ribosomal protein L16
MSLLMPKRVKYRKTQRGRRKGSAQRGSKLSYGDYGLQALENAWVTNIQIEAARVAIARNVKLGKVFIRCYPDKPITKKPAETRMGKGKGMVDAWVCVVKRGRVLFEVEGLPETIAKESMRLAASKLPIRTRFVTRKGL